MSAASDLTAASWQAFSRLLDQALELPFAERLKWIDTLGVEHDALKPALRAVLARDRGVETRQWLGTLPPLATGESASFDAADADDQAGERIGPYLLLRELGRGGMGAVWLAERVDGAYQRQVALKLPRFAGARGLAQRLARERDILAALEHPNIARLYDAGVDPQGRPYLALEFVEGIPIDRYCAQRGLSTRARADLVLQVARAVAHAHARLVVHRDLKPANILVTGDGMVRLLDFGIAKLMEGDVAAETQLTRLAGRALTPDYASPEQIRGEPIGTASDVYSLAVVAFELFTGERPYRLKRGSAAEIEEAIVAADVPLASQVARDPAARRALRGDLDAILNHALRKDSFARYASIDAFAQDIGRHLRGEPVLARPDSTGYRLRKFVGRNRLAVGAAAAVLIAVLGGTTVALWQARVAVEQARIAREQGERARKEAKQAQAVQSFLLDIFRHNSHQQADPMKARATTARELLDIGTARVGEALKDVPEAQLEVLSVLTDMYTQLSLTDEAEALRRRGLEIARKTFAPNDVRLADTLLSYSQTLHTGDRRAQIPALLQEARTILDRAGDQTSFLRGVLLYETARFQRDESLAAAVASADELVAFFRTHHPKRPTLINGLRLAARARIFAFEEAAAEPLLRQALELARQREGAAAAWMVGPLADLAEAQWAQWKVEDSERNFRESLMLSLRVNGELHAETLTSSIRLAALLMRTGRMAEGESLANSVLRRINEPKARLSSGAAANVRGILASARFDLGLPKEADATTQADVDDLRVKMPRSGALGSRLVSLADVRTALGRYDEADVLLREGEALWLRYSGNPAPAGVIRTIALVRARLALARGESQVALEHLAAIPPHPAPAGAIERLALLAEIERSDAARRAGKLEAAMRAAEHAVAALRSVPNHRLPVVEGRALVALGRAQEAAGRSADAINTLNDAVNRHATQGHPSSLWLADAQFALGKALATSNPVRARQLLVAARAIHARHGEIGPHWRQAFAAELGVPAVSPRGVAVQAITASHSGAVSSDSGMPTPTISAASGPSSRNWLAMTAAPIIGPIAASKIITVRANCAAGVPGSQNTRQIAATSAGPRTSL